MQDMAGSGSQTVNHNDHYSLVVSDLVSLIEHIQTSLKMLDAAIAGELPPGDPQAHDDIVVLDDITPCYVKANAALHACKAGLGVALHFLQGGEASISRADGMSQGGRRGASLPGCA